MVEHLPVLVTTLSMGVMALLAFLVSAIVLSVPVLASRGTAQIIWAIVVGTILLAEAAGLITLVVLVDQGVLFN